MKIEFHLLASFCFLLFAAAICYSGEPLSYADLNTWYQEPPSGSNAASLVLQGAELLNISPTIRTSNIPWIGNGRIPAPADSLSPYLNKSVADFLILNRAAFKPLRQAAAIDQSRYPVDYRKGLNEPLTHLKKIRDVSGYLSLLARYEASRGESSIAAEVLVAHFGVARSLELEPDIISQLVRIAVIRQASDALEYTFNRVSLTRDSLGKLQDLLTKLRDHEAEGISFTRALVGDRLFFAALFALPKEEADTMLKEVITNIPPNEQLSVPASQYLRKADGAFTDALHTRLVATSKLAENGRFHLMNEECLSQKADAFKKGFVVGHMTGLALKKSIYAVGKLSAYLRLAEAAVLAERHRSLTGVYPETLGQSGLVETDMIKYKKEGRGYELTATLPIASDSSSNLTFRVVAAPKVPKVTGR